MALDRQSIEKRDFPIARRGYDPAAVDEHLATVADEYDSVRRQSRTRGESTLASAASEQVRLIVEAAEQSAAEIEREAELEARQIRQDAREAAEALRSDAGTQAREHVQRVSESAQGMLDRIASMESELSSLLENLRTGASRLSSDLTLLQGSVSDVRGAAIEVDSTPAGEPDDAPEPAAEPARGRSRRAAPADPQPAASNGASDDDGAADGGGGADEEGARLIALNMALNGTPREETERYLADNFELADTDALLDDVYTRAGQ